MPTYEYRCRTCDASFDIAQSFSDSPLTHCPQVGDSAAPAACASPGKGEVRKVYSAPAITFKGNGFYKTDSRASKAKTESGSSVSESKSSDKSSDTKTSDTSGNSSSSSESTSSSEKSSEKSPSKSAAVAS